MVVSVVAAGGTSAKKRGDVRGGGREKSEHHDGQLMDMMGIDAILADYNLENEKRDGLR